jgi:hypothetical protein
MNNCIWRLKLFLPSKFLSFNSLIFSIERYHEERKLLRAKSLQKDRLVQQLVKRYDHLIRNYQRLYHVVSEISKKDPHRLEASRSEDENEEANQGIAESLKESLKTAIGMVDDAETILNDKYLTFTEDLPPYRARRRVSYDDKDVSLLFPPCQDCRTDLIEV